MDSPGTRKILIVEDDAAARRGLVALLRNAGYEVVAVNSIPAAKKALLAERPDLLITDVRLGEYNGLQLIAMTPNPIPAIVMTGFADPVLEGEARHLGAEFMLKPVTPPVLLDAVERKLSDSARSNPFRPARRWLRKRLATDIHAQVDHAVIRIVDMSYGGVRFAADTAPALEPDTTFHINLAGTTVSVNMRVVWQQTKDDSWVCGATITDEGLTAWRELVDRAS